MDYRIEKKEGFRLLVYTKMFTDESSSDDMKTPMVEVMTETFYPPDPIKVGVHNIVYALRVLGCSLDSEAMRCGIEVLNKYCLEDGTYKISGFKSVPAFKHGQKEEKNKWITLYAYMILDFNS